MGSGHIPESRFPNCVPTKPPTVSALEPSVESLATFARPKSMTLIKVELRCVVFLSVLRSDGQLPAAFAQPYRVVCNPTIEAFFEGRTARGDVQGWAELLERRSGTLNLRSPRRHCHQVSE